MVSVTRRSRWKLICTLVTKCKTALCDQKCNSRHEETAHHISACSQLLADERGFDGFTMEDLADAAGVSRRTLFNYFPGKADAVLGEAHDVPRI